MKRLIEYIQQPIMRKQGQIISAFPGTGKSYISKYKNQLGLSNFVISDSDSSEWSWIKDKNGKNTDQRDMQFPHNYLHHTRIHQKDTDILFISSHAEVRKWLYMDNVPYTLIYPNINLKDEYIQRYKDRGNDSKFIDMMNLKWNEFIEQCQKEGFPRKIELQEGQFIKDVLHQIVHIPF